jgi:hypothetical protein
MSHDPIVDEVRKARRKILDDCANDLEKLLDRLKAAEAQDRGRVVSPKPPRVVPAPEEDRLTHG